MQLRSTLFSLLVCGLLAGCATSDRMARMTPFWGNDLPDAERVNVWPVYYQNGDILVVLWPIFDLDDKGFALRPIISKEEAEWSFLHPLAGWNTETGEWWAIPAYNFEENHGVAPLWNFGEWNHVALAWWLKNSDGDVTDWGVVPFYGSGDVNHVGPVWWKARQVGEALNWGIFPLMAFDERSGWALTTYWEKDKDDEFKVLTALPLFYYDKNKDYRKLITPLGGRGWSTDSDKEFVNVLGPLYHYSSDGKRTYSAFLWPIFTMDRREGHTDVTLRPVFRYRSWPEGRSISALLGMIEHSEAGADSGLRVAPLFSHKRGRPLSLWDYFTLYTYRETQPPAPKKDDTAGQDDTAATKPAPHVYMHIGTPLLFHMHETGAKTQWSSLLNILDYESTEDESKFAFLYYLYRQHRQGEQVRRDFFPFFTWDSGPKKSSFSFLWRLFRWESVGDKSRGYA
ncbi:MAG: hypothetical protein ACYTGO_06915, partial [Planctomycetota bacterium]